MALYKEHPFSLYDVITLYLFLYTSFTLSFFPYSFLSVLLMSSNKVPAFLCLLFFAPSSAIPLHGKLTFNASNNALVYFTVFITFCLVFISACTYSLCDPFSTLIDFNLLHNWSLSFLVKSTY